MTHANEVVDYGVDKNGKPRRVPVRLLNAPESLIYWFVICVPLIWFVGPHFRPLFFDNDVWFDRSLILTLMGWIPLGIVGNVFIRVINVGVLRTASRRPLGHKMTLTGVKSHNKITRHTPPNIKG